MVRTRFNRSQSGAFARGVNFNNVAELVKVGGPAPQK
jgi:hypothetical protein